MKLLLFAGGVSNDKWHESVEKGCKHILKMDNEVKEEHKHVCEFKPESLKQSFVA